MVWIRETEELYNGTITALDDQGRKEAVLRFKNGKYQEQFPNGTKMENFGKKVNSTVESWLLLRLRKENLLTPIKLSICPKIRRWQVYSSKSKKSCLRVVSLAQQVLDIEHLKCLF